MSKIVMLLVIAISISIAAFSQEYHQKKEDPFDGFGFGEQKRQKDDPFAAFDVPGDSEKKIEVPFSRIQYHMGIHISNADQPGRAITMLRYSTSGTPTKDSPLILGSSALAYGQSNDFHDVSREVIFRAENNIYVALFAFNAGGGNPYCGTSWDDNDIERNNHASIIVEEIR